MYALEELCDIPLLVKFYSFRFLCYKLQLRSPSCFDLFFSAIFGTTRYLPQREYEAYISPKPLAMMDRNKEGMAYEKCQIDMLIW